MIKMKSSICFPIVILIMLTVTASWGCQVSLVARDTAGTGENTLKLVKDYKNSILEDISADGQLLVLYQTDAPTRRYTLTTDGKRKDTKTTRTTGDTLSVVERENGRKVGSINVAFFPENVQFMPGTQQIFFTEPTDDGQRRRFRVWNFSTGETTSCSNEDVIKVRHIIPLNGQQALGAVLQDNGGELLSCFSLAECKGTMSHPVNPSNPKSMMWGDLNLTPNKRHLAYGTSEDVIVRDVDTLATIKQIKPRPGLIFGGKPIFTPDGKFLLIVASNTVLDKPETKRFLLFYDTTRYEVAKKLDITGWRPPNVREDRAVNSNAIGTAMAISPDSQRLAIGYLREERKSLATTEQAEVVVYDLGTGKEVVRGLHPLVKQQRSDPFASKISKLAFTPDGKYLLSSTNDTLVWQVGG